MGDISDAATFLRRTYHFLMNSLPYQNLQIQPHTNTTGTNRRMEHQTAILTLVRGLASLLVAVQVLGVQFQRTCNHHSRMHIITPIIKHTHTHKGTFVARWIGSDGGIHVEARTYNEIISSTTSKPTRKQSIDDIMRLAKKIGGERVRKNYTQITRISFVTLTRTPQMHTLNCNENSNTNTGTERCAQ